MENKIFNWRPVSEYTGGRVLATNGLDVLIGEINSDGDCESEEDSGIILCGITWFIKIEEILPKSEDERIKKWIIGVLSTYEHDRDLRNAAIAWLEKQGEQELVEWHSVDEQNLNACLGYISDEFLNRWLKDVVHAKYDKPADKVEPKFKVGDWIITDKKHIWLVDEDCSTTGYLYRLVAINGKVEVAECEVVDKHARLWSIEDAKDGDVLVIEEGRRNDECIFIFKSVAAREILEYCYLRSNNTFSPTGSFIGYVDNGYHPVTKEQRDLLFQKMKEVGYMWDAEKKELKKIPNALEECEIEHIEDGKYYYCIKDYYSGGCKRASKGEVVQALRGMSMMALGAEANKYFIPVKCIVDVKPAWSEEDEENRKNILYILNQLRGTAIYKEDKTAENCIDWLKSLKDRYAWKPSEEQVNAIRLARSFVTDDFNDNPTLSEILIELEKQLKKLREE